MNSQSTSHKTKTKPRVEKLLDFYLLKRLFFYIKNHHILLLLACIFMLLTNVFSTTYPYLIKLGIDKYVITKNIAGINKIVLLLLIFLVLVFVFRVTHVILVNLLGQKLLFSLRTDILKKVFSLTMRFYDKTPIGKVLTNLTNDVESVQKFISEGIVTIVGDLLTVMIIITFMLYIDVKLTLWTMSTSILFILGTYLFRMSIRNGFRGVRQANAIMNTNLVETITGIKEIILFNHRQKSSANFTNSNRDYLHSYLKIVNSYSLYFPLIEIVTFLSMIFVLLISHHYKSATLSVGTIVAFFTYINLFFRPLRNLAEQFNALQSAMAAAERIFTLLDTKEDFHSVNVTSIHPQKLIGNIVFDKVTFFYDQKKKIFEKLSFKIQPGEKVAIVGSTGAGKTSIISLLNRFYDVQGGKITIDGYDLKKLNVNFLRKNISTLLQDTFLFSGTIYENIDLDQNHTKEKIFTAAKKTLANEFIEKLPQKYQQDVLEEGNSLSTGQKQLLALSRAFLAENSIVILDESTANIDSYSENLIHRGLENLLVGKTAIIIAHRFATIKSVDKILVLHHGNLVEQGSHQELLHKKGFYYKLYNMQNISLI